MEVAVKKIGHRLVDAQHLELFRQLELVEEAPFDEQGQETVAKALLALQEYVEHHFASEESLMERIDYPYIDQHKRLHKGLQEEVDRLKEEIERDSQPVVAEIVRLLRRWLLDHINKADADISKYLDN